MKQVFVLIFFCFSFMVANEVEDIIIPAMEKCIKESNADSCNYVASALLLQFENGGIPQESAKQYLDMILDLFDISCNKSNSSLGCLMLALIYSGDVGYLPNIKDNKSYFIYLSKSCLLNNGYACYRIGLAAYKYNQDIAIPAFKKGWELGNKESCAELSNLK